MFAAPIARKTAKSSQHAVLEPQLPSRSGNRFFSLAPKSGNQAMPRPLARRPGLTPNEPDRDDSEQSVARLTRREGTPSEGFSKIPVLSPQSMGGVQPLSPFPAPSSSGLHQVNLKISAAGDPLELEADRAADQVMNMPAPPPTPLLAAAPAQLSRQCTACGEEEKLQRKPIRAVENSTTEAPWIVHNLLRRPGESLDAPSRAYFEPRFGHDFSKVRIHVGGEAAESARSVNAQAYTVGQHVVFGAGLYAPHTSAGSRLLAHELAHVVQQSGGATAPQAQVDATETGSSGGTLVSGRSRHLKSAPASVQRKCGTELGAPAPDCTPSDAGVVGWQFLFKADCDELLPGEAANTTKFKAGSKLNVHGFASLEGDPDFNLALSCHRANKIADLARSSRPDCPVAGVFKHGASPKPQPGAVPDPNPPDFWRSAIVEQVKPETAPPVAQKLLIKNESGPTEMDCGGYSWATSWLLAKNSPAGGHIVQHIAVDYDVRNFFGSDITATVVKKKHWNYWEAWAVNAGEGAARMIPPVSPQPGPGSPPATKGGTPAPSFPVPYSAGTDTFADPDSGRGTSGKIVVSGDAQFYEGLIKLPPDFVSNNPDTQARALPSTTTDPKFTGGTSNVDHDLTVEWDCRFTKSKTKIVSHRP
jgi:hypothetical protein